MEQKQEKGTKQPMGGGPGMPSEQAMKMQAAGKKMNKFMTIAMGTSISLVLATCGVALSGHFTVPMWILSMILSVILALLIGFLLPVRKTAEKCAAKVENKMAKTLVEALVTNLFYTLIITTVLEVVMIGIANKGISIGISNIEGGINALSGQRTQMEQQLATLEADSKEYTELQGEIKANEAQVEGMKKQIEGMNAGRPSVLRALPKSMAISFVIAYVLSLILQPIYAGIGRKKYILPAMAGGPAGPKGK